MSFMYIKNNNGPRIETPHVMGRWEDECPLNLGSTPNLPSVHKVMGNWAYHFFRGYSDSTLVLSHLLVNSSIEFFFTNVDVGDPRCPINGEDAIAYLHINFNNKSHCKSTS